MQISPEPDHGPWGARAPSPPATGSGVGSVPAIRPARKEAATAPTSGVVFSGSRRDYARLMAWGLLLYIPTFGFYRFWLKTEQRRYLWAHTSLDGDAFEYRGTMRELVVGFLFAIAIYMPIAAAYSFAGLVAESYQTYASLPFFIFTVAFTHFAAFRARRYRLTRTAFRGLRFWMTGSGWKMGFAAFGWLLLTGLTGGLAYPWMQAWLERYKMGHSSYGDLPGAFAGTGWRLLKAYILPAIALVVIGTIVIVFVGGNLLDFFFRGNSAGFTAFSVVAPVVVLFFVATAWSVVSVVKTRWWLGGIRFGDVAVTSTLKATAMVGSAIRTTFVAMLAVALWAAAGLLIAGGVSRSRSFASLEVLSSDVGAIAALLAWTFVALLIAMFVKAVLYNFDFLQRVAATTTLARLDVLDQVAMDGVAQGMVGEGLADALGADGF
jgi:uncharacterized membrane protein YjgN (DUF898 family)